MVLRSIPVKNVIILFPALVTTGPNSVYKASRVKQKFACSARRC